MFDGDMFELEPSVDPDGTSVRYQLQFFSSEEFVGDRSDFYVDPSFSLDDLGVFLGEGREWWMQVRAIDEDGERSEFVRWSFFHAGADDPPVAPVLIAPEEGEHFLDLDPLFVIGHPEDPDRDEVVTAVVIAADPNLTQIVQFAPGLEPYVGQDGLETAWRPRESLPTGTWYWTATVVDPSGQITVAPEARRFSVEHSPPRVCGMTGGASVWMLGLVLLGLRRSRQ